MFGVNLILSESNDFTKIGIGLKKNTNKYQKIISVEGKKNRKDFINNIPNIYSIIPKNDLSFSIYFGREEKLFRSNDFCDRR